MLARFREQYKDNVEFRRLCRNLERKCADAFDHAADAVRSDRYRQLLIELAVWIEAGPWSRAEDEAARVDRELPIEIYAAEQLARWRKKILKKVKAFAQLDAAERHKLRINVKKFRYAAEFVASVFPSKKSKHRRAALLGSAKGVQDSLGALNDIAVHEKLSLGILNEQNETNPKLLRDLAFVAGLVAGQQEAQAVKLGEDAQTALVEFRAVRPFWK